MSEPLDVGTIYRQVDTDRSGNFAPDNLAPGPSETFKKPPPDRMPLNDEVERIQWYRRYERRNEPSRDKRDIHQVPPAAPGNRISEADTDTKTDASFDNGYTLPPDLPTSDRFDIAQYAAKGTEQLPSLFGSRPEAIQKAEKRIMADQDFYDRVLRPLQEAYDRMPNMPEIKSEAGSDKDYITPGELSKGKLREPGRQYPSSFSDENFLPHSLIQKGQGRASASEPLDIDTIYRQNDFFTGYKNDQQAQSVNAAEFESSVDGFKSIYHAVKGMYDTIKDFMENPTPENSIKAAALVAGGGSVRAITSAESLGAVGGKLMTKSKIPTAVRQEIQALDKPILGSTPTHEEIINAIQKKFPGSNITKDEFIREIDQLRGIREFMSSKPPSKYLNEETGVPGKIEKISGTPGQGEFNLVPEKRPEGWRPNPKEVTTKEGPNSDAVNRALKNEYVLVNRADNVLGGASSEKAAYDQMKKRMTATGTNAKYRGVKVEKTSDYLDRKWDEFKAKEPTSVGAAATPKGEVHYELSLEGRVQEAKDLLNSTTSQFSESTPALKELTTRYYYTLKRANEFNRSHMANEEILKNAKLPATETDKSLAKGRDFLLQEADKLHKEIQKTLRDQLKAKYTKENA
jgi:hypothetical protein